MVCCYHDLHTMTQVMGGITAGGSSGLEHIKLNLCRPWNCRSSVNKRATKKVWGVVIVDKNGGDVHCNMVMDYSAEEVIKMLL